MGVISARNFAPVFAAPPRPLSLGKHARPQRGAFCACAAVRGPRRTRGRRANGRPNRAVYPAVGLESPGRTSELFRSVDYGRLIASNRLAPAELNEAALARSHKGKDKTKLL